MQPGRNADDNGGVDVDQEAFFCFCLILLHYHDVRISVTTIIFRLDKSSSSHEGSLGHLF